MWLEDLARAREELRDYLMAEVPGYRAHQDAEAAVEAAAGAGISAAAVPTIAAAATTATALAGHRAAAVPCHACDLAAVLVPPEVAWVPVSSPDYVNELCVPEETQPHTPHVVPVARHSMCAERV